MSKPLPKITSEEVPGLLFEVNQVFTPSTPVGVADLFAGRNKQLSQLLSTIAEPGRHAVIYGERGVGKTSLAHVIKYFLPSKNRRLIFHRKPCDPSDDFTSIWKKIFQDLNFDVKEGSTTRTMSFGELYPAKLTPYDIVREMKHYNQNDVPVFVIDEFNEMDDVESSVLMANTIKALSDEASNATIIVVGVADSINQLFEQHESIDRCCEQVPMPRMSNQELGEIIDKRLKHLNFSIEPDAKTKLIVLARGLPMYVHSLGKFAALKCVNQLSRHIKETHVDKAIEEMLVSAQQSLRNKYEKATHSNQPENLFKEVLLACALTKSDDNGLFTPASVRDSISKLLNKDVGIAQYQNHLTQFITDKRGKILQRHGNERSYRFRFRDPAMQPFILMKGMVDGYVSRDLKTILSFPAQPDLFGT